MSCPRCGRDILATLSFCPGCGAPLALCDDPPLRSLDTALPLDRRTPDHLARAMELELEPVAADSAPEARAGRGHAPGSEPSLAHASVAPPASSRSHWDLGALAAAAAEPGPGAPPRRAPRGGTVEPRPDPLDFPEPEVEALEIHLRRASSGRRALAWAIDVLPLAAAVAALARALLAGATGRLPAPPSGLDGLLDLLAREAGIVLPLAALLVVALFVYTTLAHALAGATLGKWVAGVRLAGPDGRRPSLGRSAARSALALLSGALLGLGFVAALFTGSGRALHDLLARTWVVEA